MSPDILDIFEMTSTGVLLCAHISQEDEAITAKLTEMYGDTYQLAPMNERVACLHHADRLHLRAYAVGRLPEVKNRCCCGANLGVKESADD